MEKRPFLNEVLSSCQVLFGPQVHLSEDFLFYLQESGVKSAYRRRAKEVHPDVAAENSRSEPNQGESFRRLNRAYEEVLGFLSERDEGKIPCPPYRSTAKPATPKAPRDADRSASFRPSPFLPQRPLTFGEFLYLCGIIPLRTLAEAVVWQRRQRPPMGVIARQWGWLTEADVGRILALRGHGGRFGDKAVDLGLLTPRQVSTLLFYQRSRQKKLGEYFLEQGLLSVKELENLLAENRRHNSRMRSR